MQAKGLFSAFIFGVGTVMISQLVVGCAPKPIPKVAEIPNNLQSIDEAIQTLEKRKEGLQGMKYAADEEAMQHEFQSWMDYQGDLSSEDNIDAKINQIQQEIDQLKAKKAALSK